MWATGLHSVFLFFLKTKTDDLGIFESLLFCGKLFFWEKKKNKNHPVKIQPCCNYYSAERASPVLVIAAAACTARCFAFFTKLRVGEILKLGRPYLNYNSDIHLMQNLETVI